MSLKEAIEILQTHDLREAALEGVCERVERLEKIMAACRASIAPIVAMADGCDKVGSTVNLLLELDYMLREKCPICKGDGAVPLKFGTAKAQCAKCHGSGRFT